MATKKRKKSAKKVSRKRTVTTGGDRVVVENVNHPGKTSTVDGAKYREAKRALLAVLPKSGGLTQAEMIEAVRRELSSAELKPKAGWWTKCVQLDLEAKGTVVRDGKTPLRWRRA